MAFQLLTELDATGREALLRFYVEVETPEVIQADLGLSPAEWLTIKKQARTRFLVLLAQSGTPHARSEAREAWGYPKAK